MHRIVTDHISKRYGYQWIIHDLSVSFESNRIHGISGSNGSGKSTLIKMISGYLSPTKGNIEYTIQNNIISTAKIYSYVSLVAPYTDLANELTLEEMFYFHQKFKPLLTNWTFTEFEQKIELKGQGQKWLSHFSSGMKQKIQLALALLSQSPILLLDEPTSYLDAQAKSWFSTFLYQYGKDKIVIIASNDSYDLDLCSNVIKLT